MAKRYKKIVARSQALTNRLSMFGNIISIFKQTSNSSTSTNSTVSQTMSDSNQTPDLANDQTLVAEANSALPADDQQQQQNQESQEQSQQDNAASRVSVAENEQNGDSQSTGIQTHHVTIVDVSEQIAVKEVENVIQSADNQLGAQIGQENLDENVKDKEQVSAGKPNAQQGQTTEQCAVAQPASNKSGEVTSSTGSRANKESTKKDGYKPLKSHNHRRQNNKPIYTRRYVGFYQVQNSYGIKTPPYKSNFEPSETARQKADEFLKVIRQQ